MADLSSRYDEYRTNVCSSSVSKLQSEKELNLHTFTLHMNIHLTLVNIHVKGRRWPRRRLRANLARRQTRDARRCRTTRSASHTPTHEHSGRRENERKGTQIAHGKATTTTPRLSCLRQRAPSLRADTRGSKSSAQISARAHFCSLNPASLIARPREIIGHSLLLC